MEHVVDGSQDFFFVLRRLGAAFASPRWGRPVRCGGSFYCSLAKYCGRFAIVGRVS
jgi:hypothetical protein